MIMLYAGQSLQEVGRRLHKSPSGDLHLPQQMRRTQFVYGAAGLTFTADCPAYPKT